MSAAITALAKNQDALLHTLKEAADYISKLEYIRSQLTITSHGVVITMRPNNVSIWSNEALVTWGNISSSLISEIEKTYQETLAHIKSRNIQG